MFKKIGFIAIAVSAMTFQANAGETTFGVGLAQAKSDVNFTLIEEQSIGGEMHSYDSAAFDNQMLNLSLGYDFTENYGFELRYGIKANEDVQHSTFENYDVSISIKNISALLFNIRSPEIWGFSSHLSVGSTITSANFGKYNIKDSGFGLGAGINYRVNKDMIISLEYMDYGKLTSTTTLEPLVETVPVDTGEVDENGASIINDEEVSLARKMNHTFENKTVSLMVKYTF